MVFLLSTRKIEKLNPVRFSIKGRHAGACASYEGWWQQPWLGRLRGLLPQGPRGARRANLSQPALRFTASLRGGGAILKAVATMSAIFWGVFTVGLLLQIWSPHLKIEHQAFVMPQILFAAGKTISPSELVAQERIIQSLSAVLTVSGALGLAWCYWERLFGRSSSL